ncbi:SLAP domain-containing protein [Lactobacillus agrestimuris]|uniref:SLAP domain-containing protein n=1 Tax=Lactobacillus agrestimuris TaxID=2941328 RepID=UPI0020432B88|nr:SLAP domain-containing protein [Lactobacillus agrestimuris]
MKHYKRLSIYLFTILFGLAIFTFKTSSVKADDTVKLYLNHNTYVYNNKGKRVYGKGSYIKKNTIITAPGNLKKTNAIKRYYVMKIVNLPPENSSNRQIILYWLPYKIIKGQEYYKINKNKYIKCINVKAINTEQNELITNQATVVVQDPKKINQSHIYALKEGPNDRAINAFTLPKYKKLVVDNNVGFSNTYAETYHIKGTKYYIYAGDIVKRPRHQVLTHPIKTQIDGKTILY